MRKILAVFAGLMAMASVATAQSYPERVVKIVVPYSAGGGTDILARLLAEELSKKWDQSVVVENRPGGSTSIAATFVAGSEPDGYTVLLGTNTLVTNEALGRKFDYDLKTDLVPIGLVTEAATILVASSDSKFQTLQEVIDALKGAAEPMYFGHSGIAGTPHLTGELLAQVTGMNLQQVAYKGEAPALVDALAGHVDFALSSPTGALEQIRAGNLRAFGVAGSSRLTGAPDIPTIGETVAGFEMGGWFAFFAPAGTSDDVVTSFNTTLGEVLADPAIVAKIENFGMQVVPMSPADTRAKMDGYLGKVTGVVKAANIKVE